MKFDCGETWVEKKIRLCNWHRWFAWFPVKIADHDCRWLEFVERIGILNWSYDGPEWEWSYRNIS